jgi:hypothetical protein
MSWMELNPERAAIVGRIGALRRHAKYDPKVTAAKMRAGQESKYRQRAIDLMREGDPNREPGEDEITDCIARLKRADAVERGLKRRNSKKAFSRTVALRKTTTAAVPEEQTAIG